MQGNEALATILKDASDPRTALTLADTRAQDIIWKGLRWEEKGGGIKWNEMKKQGCFWNWAHYCWRGGPTLK